MEKTKTFYTQESRAELVIITNEDTAQILINNQFVEADDCFELAQRFIKLGFKLKKNEQQSY